MTRINSIDLVPYIDTTTADEDAIIAQALDILTTRLTHPAPAGRRHKLDKPQAVKDYCRLTAHDLDPFREHFRVIWLDSQLRLIRTDLLTSGTLTQASVYPREVVRAALDVGAHACIVTHNHPSGMLEASRADLALTEHLKKALDLVDIRLLDHIITSSEGATSLAELGEI